MKDKAILPIIKETEKALTPLPKAELKRKKVKRAKPPKYDTGEKNWNKQINDILTGKKETKEKKESDDEIAF